jgi:hypothetical protein
LLDKLREAQEDLGNQGDLGTAAVIGQALDFLRETDESGKIPKLVAIDSGFAIEHGPFSEFDATAMQPKIARIIEAIRAVEVLELTYTHRDGSEETLFFLPSLLCLRLGKLYVLGRQEVSEGKLAKYQPLVLRRIQFVGGRTKRYYDRAKLSTKDAYKYCFGQYVPAGEAEPVEVVLKSKSPRIAQLFKESNFYPRATVAISGETATIKLKLYNTPDLQTWLLGHAEEVQVESPKELKAELKAKAQAALKALG